MDGIPDDDGENGVTLIGLPAPTRGRRYGDYVIRFAEGERPEVARWTDIGWILIGQQFALQDEDLAEIGPKVELNPDTMSCWSEPG